MPITTTYPGIYLDETSTDVGTIVGVQTSITAFLGRADFGPVNKPTLIESFADLEELFGGLSLLSAMSYAVRDYFLNGGSQAVVVRLFHAEPGQTGVTPIRAGFLPLQAADPGSWSASLRAVLDVDVDARFAGRLKLQPTELFNLTVTEAVPGGRSERFLNVTLRQGSPRWLGTVLDNESTLVCPQSDVDLSSLAAQLADLHNRWKTLQDAQEAAAKDPAAQDAYDRAAQAWDQQACDEVSQAERELQRKQAKLTRARLALATRTAGQDSTAAQAVRDAQREVDEAATALRTALKNRSAGASDGLPLTDADLVPPDGEATRHGVFALNSLDLFNLLCLPQFTDERQWQPTTLAQLAAYCAGRRAFLIVDPPTNNPAPGWSVNGQVAARLKDYPADALDALGITGTVARNAAVFFPRLKQANPLNGGRVEEFAPCGTVAGIFARNDAARHVWKAPAGLETTLVGSVGLAAALSDADSGVLNPAGINCLRSLPAAGLVVWGARTLRGADRLADDYKYIPVRRLALYIEESLYRGTQWATFEANGEALWAQLRLSAGAFLQDLYQQGAFQGASPASAYFVKCDATTTPQSDVNRGIVNLVLGFAPLRPAEFVIIQLQQLAGQPDT